MDSFELNKIIGAVLGTLLFVMGVGFLAEAIYHPIEDRGPGYDLPEPEGTEVAEAGPAEPEVPLGVLLASASAERGATSARKCQSCHNFGEGEPNKTGPGLYDVVERLVGSHEGFAYSDGMKAHHDAGDLWTYENLNAFLTSPKTFTPGTKMSFAGIRTAEERADLLAYLQTLSGSPKPFPAAEAPAEAPAAAEGAGEEPAAEPAAPAAATETPTTTETEAPAAGTPTGSEAQPNAPAATEAPAAAPAH